MATRNTTTDGIAATKSHLTADYADFTDDFIRIDP
jgi:hypothetical protein